MPRMRRGHCDARQPKADSREPSMKRRILKLVLFLLLGAIINVAVAHPSRRAGYG